MYKKIASVGLGIILFATPLVSSAQTLSDLQAQIQALLAQIAVLQARMSSIPSASPSTSPPPVATSGGSCVALTFNMGPDITDQVTNGDVSKLQQFLVDGGLLDAGLPHGYFGPATVGAVQGWQSQHGLVSSGDPDSNGFGAVGPRTRAAMGCGGSTPLPIPPVSPHPKDSFSASPTSGAAPLDVTFTIPKQPTKANVYYSLYFGDGASAPLSSPGGPIKQTVTHTYTTNGEYAANLFQTEDICGTGIGNYGCTRQLNVASVTINASSNATTSDGHLTVASAQQPANSLAPQGAIVPFTTFTLTNNGSAPVQIDNVIVQRTGLASDAVFAAIDVFDQNKGSTAYQGFDSNHQVKLYLGSQFVIQPGQTMTYTISGRMASNLSANAGQTVSLSLVGIGTSAHVSGSLPITGAQQTINNSLNACYPPQTSLYGYKCWDSGTGSAVTLTVSTDASSPSYQIVAGGTTGVTLGVFSFRATGEAINLNRMGLTLSQGKPSDISNIYFYNGTGTLLGTAVFTANSSLAVSTFSTQMNIPRDTDARVIVKADIASIGTSQPGTAGDLIVVYPGEGNTKGTGVSSGLAITAQTSGYKDIPGVRIFKSYPSITAMPLPSSGLEDGRLQRFSVTANPSGTVGLGKFSFRFNDDGTRTIDTLNLYAFSDSGFSQPIRGFSSGLVASSPWNVLSPSQPIEIPAGATYYFELRSKVSSLNGGSASITTTLLGDASSQNGMSTALNIPGNFIWSPNDLTTSSFSDSDWTQGSGIPGLPPGGISQTRTGGGTPPPPPPPPTACQVVDIYAEQVPGYVYSNLFMTVRGLPTGSGSVAIAGADSWNSLMFNSQGFDTTGNFRLQANQTINSGGVSYILQRKSSIVPISYGGVPISCQPIGGTIPTPAPTCSISYDATTISNGQTLGVTWSSSNATTRSYNIYRSDGSLFFGPQSVEVNGGFSDPNAATDLGVGTFTRRDTVTGPGGTGTCSATLKVISPTCTYVPASGRASTINIEGGQDACSSWCSSQALEDNVTYSCAYNNDKIAMSSASKNANVANALTALNSLEAVLQMLLMRLGQ